MRKLLAAIALVALVSCGQVAASTTTTPAPVARPFHPPSTWGLFLADTDTFFGHSWSLTRLDAASLKDAAPAGSGTGYTFASADGSTMVEVDYNQDGSTAVRVVDARTGQVRSAFQPTFATDPLLTADGSHLLVTDSYGRSYRVFDTSTGGPTGSLQQADAICCGTFPVWLDPSGRFLYGMVVPGSGIGAKGPGTPVLIRYDLRSGKEDGRLTLKDVQAGVWKGDRAINSDTVADILIPGAALSPDGARLAVLYQDGTRLMLIDTAAMRITSSRAVTTLSLLTSGLGLRPIEAEAKYEQGVTWSLTYAPDGGQLFASEQQTAVDQNGKETTSGMGVRLIDVASARVLAEASNLDIPNAYFAPDGSAVYGVASSTDPSGTTTTTLMRLDTASLAVAARRQFSGWRSLLILAR